jgi:biopolymer transport protein TolQ
MYNSSSFLLEIWLSVSPLAEASLLLLLAMFLWVLLEGVERAVIYGVAVRQSRGFLDVALSLLEHNECDGVLALAEARKRSHIAAVFASALREFRYARKCLSVEPSLNIAKRAAHIERNLARERLREGLTLLGSIATTAPLVGFFGTIIGILDSFRGFIGPHALWIALTAASISEALVCAAAGILLAVPTVWCFNWRRERLSAFDAEMKIAEFELAKYLRQYASAGRF